MASISVATYYRMSTMKQEDSIDRQRSQVLPYCEKHGYQIVREYMDEGIAGDEILKRKDFQRMLRDAQAGAFQAVVCDDKDRFGRFDAIDLGEVVAPLRRKGVWVETVAQGRIDWTTFAGRITDAILQEAKSMESEAISRRVLSSQLLKSKSGIYTGGRAAYGYRWEPDADRGKRLVPDDRTAEVVRLVFRLYDEGQTLVAIATELHRRGVVSPKGQSCWTRAVLQRLLRNRRYVGDWTWGVHPQGKRHRYGVNGLVPSNRHEHTPRRNPAAAWLVIPDSHEPLVDRETFERVQNRLATNKTLTTPHVGGNGFVLSRLMICGQCGSYLCGITNHGKREYVCRGYLAFGKNRCFKNSVAEQPILRLVIRKLQEAYLDPANLAALRREVAATQKRERSEGNLKRLQRQIGELAQKIQRGNERLLILPPDRLPGVVDQLRGWERDLDAAKAELARVEAESPVDRLETTIAAAEAALWRLRDAVQEADSYLLRDVLREMVEKIELSWEQIQRGKKTFSRLTGGVVWTRSQTASSLLSPSAGQTLQALHFTTADLAET